MKTRKTIEIELTGKRERLELYLKRAPAKPWASSPVTGERSPERGFFHRLTPGVFAPFLPAPAIFTRRR